MLVVSQAQALSLQQAGSLENMAIAASSPAAAPLLETR